MQTHYDSSLLTFKALIFAACLYGPLESIRSSERESSGSRGMSEGNMKKAKRPTAHGTAFDADGGAVKSAVQKAETKSHE